LPRSQMCLKITSPESPRRGKKVKRETKSFIGRESYYPNFDDVWQNGMNSNDPFTFDQRTSNTLQSLCRVDFLKRIKNGFAFCTNANDIDWLDLILFHTLKIWTMQKQNLLPKQLLCLTTVLVDFKLKMHPNMLTRLGIMSYKTECTIPLTFSLHLINGFT